MVKKLFFSLLGLLASLVALWGVMRQGWTWEMVVPALVSMLLFAVALLTGNGASARNRAEPIPDHSPRRQAVTQRYEWGELTGRSS